MNYRSSTLKAGEDLVSHWPTFDSHVHYDIPTDTYEGYVYLGSEIIFTLTEPATRTPAGLSDFSHVLKKKFAQRLAVLMQPEEPFDD